MSDPIKRNEYDGAFLAQKATASRVDQLRVQNLRVGNGFETVGIIGSLHWAQTMSELIRASSFLQRLSYGAIIFEGLISAFISTYTFNTDRSIVSESNFLAFASFFRSRFYQGRF